MVKASSQPPWTEKIASARQVAQQFESLRGQQTLVTTNGCFDLLHPGHLALLHHCACLSPTTVVLINSDASIKRLKGPTRPIQNEQTRAQILASLIVVWRVIIFSEDTPIETLKILRPNIHIKGADYQNQDLPEAPLLRELGARLEFFPLIPGQSTTEMIAKLKGSL